MATTSELLAEAEAAYHALLVGQQVVEVRDSNGELVRFNQSSRASLAAYIETLRRTISGRGCGPMQVWM